MDRLGVLLLAMGICALLVLPLNMRYASFLAGVFSLKREWSRAMLWLGTAGALLLIIAGLLRLVL